MESNLTDFLSNLEHRLEIGTEFAELIRLFWSNLLEKCPELLLVEPCFEIRDDKGKVARFTWSKKELLIEIEVFPEGEGYWFGMDRMTGGVNVGKIVDVRKVTNDGLIVDVRNITNDGLIEWLGRLRGLTGAKE